MLFPKMHSNCYAMAVRFIRLRILLLFVLTVLMSSSAVQANNYYVDPAGNDANNGNSPSSAWQTLAKVSAAVFSPGDTIRFISGGVWAGQLLPQGSGIAGNPIVVDMYGTGKKPLINGPGANASVTLKLVNQSYWEVNNLEITNTQITGGSAQLTGILMQNTGTTALSHIYVKNCYVHDVNSVGIGNANYSKGTGGIFYSGWINDALVKGCHVANVQIEGIRNSSTTMCDHFVIDSNLIENVYGDGIVLHGAQNGSAITRNTLYNVCMSSAANFAGAWTYLSNQTTVAYNEVYGIKGGEGSNDGQAFDADISTNGDIFEYNYSHDNDGGFMLFMPSATNIIVRYNISVNDCIGGTILKLFNYTATSSTNKIYNNTFYLSNNINEIFQTGFNGVFNNNIIYSPGTVKQFATAPISSSSVFSNNCFYPSSITATNGPAGTVSGNIYADPGFVRPGFDSLGMNAVSAYKLLTSSPCRNTGVLMSNNGGVDYFNTPLPAGSPDIGAIQHTDTSTVKQVTVGTIADSYARDGTYANTNFGTATTMVVKSDAAGYNRNAFMKFAFTDTAVTAAVLRFYVPAANTDPTRVISVYGITDTSWGETAITWNNMPTAGTKLGTITVTNQAGTWYQFDVTSYIQSNIAAKKVSFRLVNEGTPGSKNDFSINTKEAVSNWPQLVITGSAANKPMFTTIKATGIITTEQVRANRSLTIYPNPAKGRVNILVPKAEGVIRVVDINGIVQLRIPVFNTKVHADVQELSPGVYFVNYMVQGSVKSSQKMIILP